MTNDSIVCRGVWNFAPRVFALTQLAAQLAAQLAGSPRGEKDIRQLDEDREKERLSEERLAARRKAEMLMRLIKPPKTRIFMNF